MKTLPSKIEILSETKLIVKHLKMTYANNRTIELWQSFMPHRKAISNKISGNLYSMQVYENTFDFNRFNQNTEFVKYAGIEVSDFNNIPENMEPYNLKGGLYVVFDYKGLSTDFRETFEYIFNIWLPNSEFEVDNREHFEVLGEKYKNNDPSSEEEIWIPIKTKK